MLQYGIYVIQEDKVWNQYGTIWDVVTLETDNSSGPGVVCMIFGLG